MPQNLRRAIAMAAWLRAQGLDDAETAKATSALLPAAFRTEGFATTLFLQGRQGTEAEYDRDKASRRMLATLARARIPHVGMLEAFREHLRRTGISGYFEFDQHWNAAGHALAAELIAQALERQALLPAR